MEQTFGYGQNSKTTSTNIIPPVAVAKTGAV